MVFHASEFFLVLSLLLKVFLYSLAGDVLQSLLGAKTVRASYDLACVVVGKYCFFQKVAQVASMCRPCIVSRISF